MNEREFSKTAQNYRDAVEFLLSLQNIAEMRDYMNVSRVHNPARYLKRITFFLNLIGNPQNSFKIIHVGGTSGKGTATARIQSILSCAGYKCGAYFSPHVTTLTERFQINDTIISPSEFADIVEKLKPSLDYCLNKSPYGVPSFFEILTAIAFYYFKEQRCDYAVLEVGCGGRYDATNAVRKIEASVITEIGKDHTELLGNTLQKIAREKLGIVKKRGILFTYEKRPALIKFFKSHCKKLGAKLVTAKNAEHLSSLVAEHIGIENRFIQEGMKRAFLPCRFEIVSEKPLVILDGAHNPDKIAFLTKKLKNELVLANFKKIWFIFTSSSNKNWKAMCRMIAPLAHTVLLTRHTVAERSVSPLHEMKKAILSANKNAKVLMFIEPANAITSALHEADDNDLIIATGSIYMLGSIRARWMSEEQILKKRTNRIK